MKPIAGINSGQRSISFASLWKCCRIMCVHSNGEAERRAVFAAPNEGTLSRTSTYQ
jgi:hypothetical protein